VLGYEPGWEALTAALAAGWAESLRAEVRPDRLTPAESAEAARLAEHYAAPAWTWHQ
jgi:hypothetical protein